MHIFVSYAKQDSARLARQIYEALCALPGVTAWMDMALRPGKGWASQIQSEIQKSDCVVVLLSPDVNRDPAGKKGVSFVINEIEYAQRLNKPIIPIMAQTTLPPVQLVSVQYLDFTADVADGLKKLIAEIETMKSNLPTTANQFPPGQDVSQPASSAARQPLLERLRARPQSLVIGLILLGIIGLAVTVALMSANTARPNAFATLAFTRILHNDDWSPIIRSIDAVDMALVPPGCFRMGSSDGDLNEQPVNDQCFTEPFWIDRLEVTRALYAQCVQDNAACDAVPMTEYSSSESQPVANLSWSQADSYCRWRKGRLPSEREWEYAARGPDNLVYPWGNEMVKDNLVYLYRFGKQTSEAGIVTAGASWVGALDMSGNVMEWIQTPYGDYAAQESPTPAEDSSVVHLARGGYFGNVSDFSVRSAYRVMIATQDAAPFVGIRCVNPALDA